MQFATKEVVTAFVLIALSGQSIAKPTKTTHSIAIVEKEGRNVLGALVDKLAEEGIQPEPSLVRAADVAAAAETSGTAKAIRGPFDALYLVNTNVGGQDMRLQIDTGSSDLWGLTTKLTRKERGYPGRHALYDFTGTQAAGKTFNITYVDGSGEAGDVWVDSVAIGDLTVEQQEFEAADWVSQGIKFRNSDGIFGFGFPGLNRCLPTACTTWLQNVLPTLAKPLFTLNLGKHKPGSMEFGYTDSSNYVGKIEYVPVDTSLAGPPRWYIQMAGYSQGTDKMTRFPADTGATVDSGAPLIVMPNATVIDFWSKVPGAAANSDVGGFWTIPCNQTIPDFSLWLTTAAGKLHQSRVPGNFLNLRRAYRGGPCFCGLQARELLGFPRNYVGDTILKSQYAVFDFGSAEGDGLNPRIGFAQQPGLPAPVSL